MKQQENIHPIFDKMQSREAKEQQLRQRGLTVWFTGLSGSGKSTIAVALEHRLSQQGIFSRILDGDNIRTGINRGLGFSEEDRRENIRRIAEVSKLFTETGIVTLCAFVSPTNDLREMAREIIAREGIFAGMSSGAAMLAARRTAERIERGNIVVLFADRAEKYLSTKMFEPFGD
jgi:adenylylsulfate kinase